jgi:hypothetical protein
MFYQRALSPAERAGGGDARRSAVAHGKVVSQQRQNELLWALLVGEG